MMDRKTEVEVLGLFSQGALITRLLSANVRAERAEKRVKELEAQIAQAKNDLSEYRAEIERLTRKAMTE